MNDKVRLRMCAGCRNKIHQTHLIRICRKDNKIIVDKNNQTGGRGAYICSKECLDKAKKTNQFNRLLKSSVPEEIYNELYEEFK